MKKKQTAFRIPPELVEWMTTQEGSQTDLVVEGLRLLSEMDSTTLKEEAKELGLTPGRLVDVAVHHFESLSPREKRNKIADYFEYLSKKE